MLIKVIDDNKTVLRVDTAQYISGQLKSILNAYKLARKTNKKIRIIKVDEKDEDWLKSDQEWEELLSHFEED